MNTFMNSHMNTHMNISNHKIEIIRSNRKSIALQIKTDGRIIVRAPRYMSKTEINRFITEHTDWIQKHLEKQEKYLEQQEGTAIRKLTKKDLEVLANKAMQVIPERVAFYAPKVGVTYGRITIRNQKTRWGSCSSKGNLNFNCLLMLMPMEVIDSVVVHELCHRKEMNHSKAFYNEVLRVYPQYDTWNKWLKENGPQIMRRMTG